MVPRPHRLLNQGIQTLSRAVGAPEALHTLRVGDVVLSLGGTDRLSTVAVRGQTIMGITATQAVDALMQFMHPEGLWDTAPLIPVVPGSDDPMPPRWLGNLGRLPVDDRTYHLLVIFEQWLLREPGVPREELTTMLLHWAATEPKRLLSPEGSPLPTEWQRLHLRFLEDQRNAPPPRKHTSTARLPTTQAERRKLLEAFEAEHKENLPHAILAGALLLHVPPVWPLKVRHLTERVVLDALGHVPFAQIMPFDHSLRAWAMLSAFLLGHKGIELPPWPPITVDPITTEADLIRAYYVVNGTYVRLGQIWGVTLADATQLPGAFIIRDKPWTLGPQADAAVQRVIEWHRSRGTPPSSRLFLGWSGEPLAADTYEDLARGFGFPWVDG